MNDAPVRDFAVSQKTPARVVRPRDAASLILLRGERDRVEVLVGRRPLAARFMPGVYVFPGGAIDPPDRRAWGVESGAEALPARLVCAARAALRETWEEVGVLVGRAADVPLADGPDAVPVTRAYRKQGLVATLDGLTYVGRAITPPHSPRRFNTRFFLGDGELVQGEPEASTELEDAGWRRLDPELIEGFRDVTRFMLARAVALRQGTANGPPPLFYTAKNVRRVGICREASR
jgi:8-oxo-dGTP pyrophosphatase MutT (NUDIX family)